MREPKSLIFHEKTEKFYPVYMYAYMRNTKSLLRYGGLQYLPNICPCLPNVPKFCSMLFAVKSRISFDMFMK